MERHIKTWEELNRKTKLFYLHSAKRRINEGTYDQIFLSGFNSVEELAKFIYDKSVNEWYGNSVNN